MDTVIREAAMARFKRGTVRLRLNDGTQISPGDSAHETQIKVNLFKRLLAQEKVKEDPSFLNAAEQSLFQKRPAEIIIQWDEPSGSQQVRFLAEATADCALPMQSEFQVGAGELSRHPCLQRDSLRSLWAAENPVLTVEILPLDSHSSDWPQLLDGEMKELAALDFVRTQGHRLTASLSPGRKE